MAKVVDDLFVRDDDDGLFLETKEVPSLAIVSSFGNGLSLQPGLVLFSFGHRLS